jgi:hypothetical protein
LALFSDNCPSGWVYFDNKCYLFDKEPVTQEAAEAKCRNLGARLLEIDSAAENRFIVDRAISSRTANWFDYMWTGFWLGKCSVTSAKSKASVSG